MDVSEKNTLYRQTRIKILLLVKNNPWKFVQTELVVGWEALVADTEEALMPVVHWQVQSVVLLAFVAQPILCVPEVCLFFEFYLLDWVWNFFMKQETFFSQFMQHNLQSNLLNRNIGLRLKQYSIGEKYFHQYFWRCFLLISEMFPETS